MSFGCWEIEKWKRKRKENFESCIFYIDSPNLIKTRFQSFLFIFSCGFLGNRTDYMVNLISFGSFLDSLRRPAILGETFRILPLQTMHPLQEHSSLLVLYSRSSLGSKVVLTSSDCHIRCGDFGVIFLLSQWFILGTVFHVDFNEFVNFRFNQKWILFFVFVFVVLVIVWI